MFVAVIQYADHPNQVVDHASGGPTHDGALPGGDGWLPPTAYSPTLPPIVASRAPARAARFAPLMSATGKMNPAQQISGLVKGDLSLQAVPDAEVGSPSIALCDPEACTEVVSSGTVHRAKVGSYFGVWFALSIVRAPARL